MGASPAIALVCLETAEDILRGGIAAIFCFAQLATESTRGRLKDMKRDADAVEPWKTYCLPDSSDVESLGNG